MRQARQAPHETTGSTTTRSPAANPPSTGASTTSANVSWPMTPPFGTPTLRARVDGPLEDDDAVRHRDLDIAGVDMRIARESLDDVLFDPFITPPPSPGPDPRIPPPIDGFV